LTGRRKINNDDDVLRTVQMPNIKLLYDKHVQHLGVEIPIRGDTWIFIEVHTKNKMIHVELVCAKHACHLHIGGSLYIIFVYHVWRRGICLGVANFQGMNERFTICFHLIISYDSHIHIL
jgi:hypothetical protein